MEKNQLFKSFLKAFIKSFALIIAIFLLIMFILFLCGVFHEHTIEKKEIAATCKTPGKITEFCSKCDYSVEKETPIAPHDMQEHIVHKEATCTENGSATFKCSYCNKLEEREIYAYHSFSGDECTKCGAVRSDTKPDTWYTLNSNNVFHCQNADIRNAIPTQKGSVFMVTYFPVCTQCHIRGTMQMTGVGVNTPVSETYYCKSCGNITYAKFKIEY